MPLQVEPVLLQVEPVPLHVEPVPLQVELILLHVVPSSVNSLYTPLGSIDSLPPPYLPRLSGESNPVFGEQKRLSTYWSARTRASAGGDNE